MTSSVPDEWMGSLIRETFRAMSRSFESHLDGTGLILSQWLTLRLVGTGKISCIGHVDRELGLESGASTRLVDQLEGKGLLLRRRSDVDRRVVGIAITPGGMEMLASIQPQVTGYWSQHLSIFTAEERDQLFVSLSRLRDHLVADIDAPDIERDCA